MDSFTVGVAPTETAPPATTMTRAEWQRKARRPAGLTAMPWIVTLVTLVLRLLTAATSPTDWDSAQYAAAVGHFDVTHGQPQPPGYWLYVVAGRLIHRVTGLGTIHSLVLVAALASAAAAGLTALAGRDLGGWWVGLAAGTVVATCPFAWFSGSIVATYSFDMLACALLIILAWRARPGSWHGVAAVVALGILCGFRQSILQSFAVLALLAVIGSTRHWARLGLTVAAGAGAIGVWLIPMSLSQPGGVTAWLHATRTEATGAARSTSVLDHAAAGAANLGTFAAYTVVALGPLIVLALVAGVVLCLRTLTSSPTDPEHRMPDAAATDPRTTEWRRPWYQTRTAVLGAAIVPPMALVALVQFAKGGYLLAYLPAAVIALLLPLAALNRGRWRGWMAITSLGVVVIAALGAQRFLDGNGVVPQRWVMVSGGLWFQQTRYQAPYADTRATIRSADGIDTALRGLDPSVAPDRDVVVFDTLDDGGAIYRNAGWALPDDRVALVSTGAVVYNQLDGALYYASGDTVQVGLSGAAYLVASPTLPGLDSLIARGSARPVSTPLPIADLRVWRISPGAGILGVQVVATTGHRPLGQGL
jgi:hypothetical protein